MPDEPTRDPDAPQGPPPASYPESPPQRPAPQPPPPPQPPSPAPPPPGLTQPDAATGWSPNPVESAPGIPSEPDRTHQPWAQTPPPTQQGWGQASAPTRLQPIGGLATAAKVTLGIMTLLSAVSVALEVNYASKIDRLFNGDGSFSEALDAENVRGGFSAVFVIGTLVTAVLWALWVQRARVNATALGAAGQRQTDGMAVGGWFIPLANVVIGKLMLNDLWRANDPTVPSGYRIEGRPVSGLVNTWWVLWMVGWWISRGVVAASDAAFDDFDVETALNLVRINAFIETGFIAAGVLAIVIVGQITTRQRERAAIFGIMLD